MKKLFFSKASLAAVALCVSALSITAFASQLQGNGTAIDESGSLSPISTTRFAEAKATDKPLYETEDGAVLYQDNTFTLCASPVNTCETTAFEENGEPFLVERKEYVDGDYRYVDEIYCQQIASPARSLDYWVWTGTHEVYYEISNNGGIHLATMKIEGTYAVNENQNIAIVDEDSVKCTTTKYVNGTYPKLTELKPRCESDISNGAGNPRSARISYVVLFEKTSSDCDVHPMYMEVNSKNICKVICDHFPAKGNADLSAIMSQ